MESTVTLAQGAHILRLIEEKGVSKEQLNGLIKSGLLADLLDADPTSANRDDFRKLLGLGLLKFKTWRTLKLGTGLKTGDDFRRALKKARYKISNWADEILGKPIFMVAIKETGAELVVVSVAELGFKNGATRKEIYDRALELGLVLCPVEVGPQLRLQYPEHFHGECLLIAMEPITVSDGSLDVFCVVHDGDGRWLRTSYGRPESKYSSDTHWVFMCR